MIKRHLITLGIVGAVAATVALLATGRSIHLARMLRLSPEARLSRGVNTDAFEKAPLSAVVALQLEPARAIPSDATIPAYIAKLIDLHEQGNLPQGFEFPVPAVSDDELHVTTGLRKNVVIRWLDPLTETDGGEVPRFGANNDFLAWLGDGWADPNTAAGELAPQWRGSSEAGMLWANHEYVSNQPPTPVSPPNGAHFTLARFYKNLGVITNDPTDRIWIGENLRRYVRLHKKQVGGTFVRVHQLSNGNYTAEPSPDNRRFDATSATLLRITGLHIKGFATDDAGFELPDGVVPGTLSNCSGGLSPWGTIFTAEENTFPYYGDLEECWTSDNRFVYGKGCDAGSTFTPDATALRISAYGVSPDPHDRKARDYYGFITETDPTAPTADDSGKTAPGVGHRKLGAMGRARWENATFATASDGLPFDQQPLVIYAGDDRPSGRIYKFVSAGTWRRGMTREETRQLLDTGKLYVAHFAGLDNIKGITFRDTDVLPVESQRGRGRWVELSLDSTDEAPNAAALGRPGLTVGEALRDRAYNGIAGFVTNDDVLRALFTASNKIGIFETNRPEDIEWNARDKSGTPRLYVSFTRHTIRPALDPFGVLYEPRKHADAPPRTDEAGSIFTIEESAPMSPAASNTFSFWVAFRGIKAKTPNDPFAAAMPDNLLITRDGDIYFTTDGNEKVNRTNDGVYALRFTPNGPAPSRAYRIVSSPSDSEPTGPLLLPNQEAFFLSIQHPGEDKPSTWPHNRPEDAE